MPLATMFIIAIVLMVAAGVYCIIATHNLLRVLIAMELANKAAILFLLLAGAASGQMALAEGFIITLIIIEVVVTAIGALLCIALHARTGSLDIRIINKNREDASVE